MPLAGVFCDSKIGWQGIFYLQGGLTIIAFGAFFAIFNDSPKFHRFSKNSKSYSNPNKKKVYRNVSSKELYKINFGKLTNGTSKGLKIPYYKIFTDKSVLGVIIASIGAGVGFQVSFIQSLKKINKVQLFLNFRFLINMVHLTSSKF